MPRPLSRRELIRKLRKFGFAGPFSGGRHEFMRKENCVISIPNPHGKDVGSSLLSQIIRDIGIPPKDFNAL